MGYPRRNRLPLNINIKLSINEKIKEEPLLSCAPTVGGSTFWIEILAKIDSDFCGNALLYPPCIFTPALAAYPEPSGSRISKCIGRSQSSQKLAPK